MTISAGVLWTAGLIFFLLIISAFLSGSETALTATSKARILRLQQEGQRRARWVIVLLEQKERLLSAIYFRSGSTSKAVKALPCLSGPFSSCRR